MYKAICVVRFVALSILISFYFMHSILPPVSNADKPCKISYSSLPPPPHLLQLTYPFLPPSPLSHLSVSTLLPPLPLKLVFVGGKRQKVAATASMAGRYPYLN